MIDIKRRDRQELLEYLLAEEGIDSPQPQTIPLRDNADALPLSFAQQRLWVLYQLQPESAAYNEPTAVRLRGVLNVAALEQGINDIVRRHDVLRTTFAVEDGRPSQHLRDTLSLPLPVVELHGLPGPEQEAQVRTLTQEEFRQPFDLTQGPLLRVKLLRLAETDHVFLLTMHHTISDGWSVGVFFQELGALYDALSSDKPAALAALPIQYADFAHWQCQGLGGDVLAAHLAYWKRQLAGSLPLLELPTDHARPPIQTFCGARQYLSLPMSLSEALKAVSQQEGVTLFMLLLAAFQTLLHRYTGQADILVGSPIAGRNWPEVEGLIGCFLNTLVLRTDLSGNPRFRELLGRVREVALGAYAHQELPFEHLVEELQPERDLSRNPLFQVMFVLQNALRLELPGLSLHRLEPDRGASPFDVILSMEETEQGLHGWWEYNTGLFEPATIRRIAEHFRTLLEGIVANPEQRLADLPLLTPAEQQQVLVEWNNTQADYPGQICLHHLFEAQVERTPEATAVVCEDTSLTYRELHCRANQLAHCLQRLGVGPDVLVGLCMERSLAMVVGIFGVLKAGGAYVPLDPAYPQERLAFMLEDSRTPVLLTQQRLLAGLPEHGARVICLDTDWERVAAEPAENPVSSVAAEHVAYAIYTSGSTGQPKGVLIPHRAICNHMLWMQETFPLTAADRVVQKTPCSFDASVWEFFAPLFAGAQLIMARPGGHQDSAYLVELLAGQQVTILQLVPSLLHMLLEEDGFAACTSLRRVFCGGEALPVELQERFFTRLPMAGLYNLYGPTEASIDATFWACERGSERGAVPIGRPVANTQIYVLDAHLQPVPVGIPGELHIGGTGLARGYLNRPELTAEKFIPHPWRHEPGARVYKTGDLVRYLPHGALEFLGRIDHQVKLRGFRIELGEIEAVLGQHPSICKSVVLVREDTPGDQRLVAYVVPDQVQAPETSALRHWMKQRLPEYMVPSAFVCLENLPLTPNGKVDRRALPAPDSSRLEPVGTYVVPRDVLEVQLSKVWEKVLGRQPIGVRDNFFELGGHSLLALRLIAQIEKMAGARLPLATLFQAPTVEQLASLLRQEDWQAPWSALVAMQPAGTKPPFFCMHAAAGNVLFYSDLARCLGPDQPLYGLQALGLDGRQAPYARVEDMAAHYIKEIRTVQPEGPYYLGGLSFGGTIAFEMAQQLQAQGQLVATLVLFDTYGPGYPNISRRRYLRDKIADLVQRVRKNVMDLQRLDLVARAGLLLEKVQHAQGRFKRRHERKLEKMREERWRLAYKVYVRTGRALPPELRHVQVRESDHQAHRNYAPTVYPGRMILFRASKQPAGCLPDPYLGWGELAAGGVEVYEIPGPHSHSLLREPYVRVLAEKLQACLRVAQERNPST